MADRGSARRGSYNSFICGGNRVPSGLTGNTPAAIDSTAIGVDLAADPPTPPPDPDISVPQPVPIAAADFIEPQKTARLIKAQGPPLPFGHPGKHG